MAIEDDTLTVLELMQKLALFHNDVPVVALGVKGEALPVTDVGLHLGARSVMVVIKYATHEAREETVRDEPEPEL